MFACHVSSIGVLYFQHRGAIFERRDTILFGGAHALHGRKVYLINSCIFFLFYFAMRGFGGRLDATMWR